MTHFLFALVLSIFCSFDLAASVSSPTDGLRDLISKANMHKEHLVSDSSNTASVVASNKGTSVDWTTSSPKIAYIKNSLIVKEGALKDRVFAFYTSMDQFNAAWKKGEVALPAVNGLVEYVPRVGKNLFNRDYVSLGVFAEGNLPLGRSAKGHHGLGVGFNGLLDLLTIDTNENSAALKLFFEGHAKYYLPASLKGVLSKSPLPFDAHCDSVELTSRSISPEVGLFGELLFSLNSLKVGLGYGLKYINGGTVYGKLLKADSSKESFEKKLTSTLDQRFVLSSSYEFSSFKYPFEIGVGVVSSNLSAKNDVPAHGDLFTRLAVSF